MSNRRPVTRTVLVALLAALTLVGSPAFSAAVPPPPPNPSDEELDAGRDQVEATAGKVGRLANQVAEADAQLSAIQAEVALAHEEANRALLELQRAEQVAAAAQAAADAARAEADAAAARVRTAQQRLDEFAAASYRQLSVVGGVTAFLGSDSPKDLLARASLLEAVSGSQLDALDNIQRARIAKANKDSAARAALADAQAKQRLAEQARAAAEQAYQAAIDAENAQAERAAQFKSRKADLERKLYEAQQAVRGLENQRQRYEEWQAEREREQAAAAAAAAADSSSASSASSAPSDGSVRDVIERAKSQLGVTYAWGGGDADGATYGIRDGGVADAHGDYNKIGFDCSGLMIYAFAPEIGYSLPHYSGWQYDSGTKVPLSQKQPGDMLFWATDGRIHHVALYIGDGMMIEAPYSGGEVRIAPVRTAGIMPYAVRLL